jgi:hypothetical protein
MPLPWHVTWGCGWWLLLLLLLLLLLWPTGHLHLNVHLQATGLQPSPAAAAQSNARA